MQSMMKRILARAAVLLFCHTATADLDAGLAAIKERNFDKAWTELLSAANEGNAQAQYLIGTFLANRFGRRYDRTAALAWFGKAAAQAYPPARTALALDQLATATERGEREQALVQLRELAAEGDLDAQTNLASALMFGRWGVEKDIPVGLKLMETAALRGHVPSQSALAFHYGRDPDKADYAKARQWYAVLIASGDEQAFIELGKLYAQGRGGEVNHKYANELYRAMADKRCEARMLLARQYEAGNGVAQSYAEAAALYGKDGTCTPEAEFRFGVMLATGLGIAKDEARAAALFRSASRNMRDPTAALALGWMYANGRGVPKSTEQARNWYRAAIRNGDKAAPGLLGLSLLLEAAQTGDQDAIEQRCGWPLEVANLSAPVCRQFRFLGRERTDTALADLLESLAQTKYVSTAGQDRWPLTILKMEQDVKQDALAAASAFRAAAEDGNSLALNILGAMYQTGYGVRANDTAAFMLYLLASEREVAYADEALSSLTLRMKPQEIQRALQQAKVWSPPHPLPVP